VRSNKQLRSGDAPDLETAKTLIDRLFFNEKRYDPWQRRTLPDQ